MMICKADFEDLFPHIFKPGNKDTAHRMDDGDRPTPIASSVTVPKTDAKFGQASPENGVPKPTGRGLALA